MGAGIKFPGNFEKERLRGKGEGQIDMLFFCQDNYPENLPVEKERRRRLRELLPEVHYNANYNDCGEDY